MYAEVIVDILNNEVDKIFDYLVPENMQLVPGTRVLLPFAKSKNMVGYVVRIKDTTLVPAEKLKSIIKPMENYPLIKPELMELCLQMKEQYFLRMADCMRLMIPTQVRSGEVKEIIESNARLNPNDEVIALFLDTVKRTAKNQIAAIEYLNNKGEELVSRLNQKFGAASIKKLVENNIVLITKQRVLRDPLKNVTAVTAAEVNLTNAQLNCVNDINCNKAKTFLLHGVTGSGKTEVYMHVINNVLNKGKTAIMLVPEIALTPQVVTHFKSRFGQKIAVLHSGLSNGEKFDEWYRIFKGEVQIVVGARSAVFAPLTSVGVIIIDEEHDGSYISENNPRYITHEVAEFRSKYNNCPLVLGSATPNIESYYKAKTGEYTLLELPLRINNQPMPEVQITDMLAEFRSGNSSGFSAELISQLNEVVNNNQQAMLFINRRGFSTYVMCLECGHIPKCTDCDVSLVYHRDERLMKCHFCGKSYKMLTGCPQCKSQKLKLGGIGTQRVVAELSKLFPNTKILRMDNDTTTTKNAHAQILAEFAKTKPCILVGTQMIAKGHDFPAVTFVGILDADLSLWYADFRAAEKTYQLITQVAGRAGRADLTGRVILQTYFPKHFVYKLAANYNYKQFYEREINLREATQFPPFSKIVKILISGLNDDQCKQYTHELFLKLKNCLASYSGKVHFLKAMKSPITRIEKKYRYQIIIRLATNNHDIIKEINTAVSEINQKEVTVFIETNPQNFN